MNQAEIEAVWQPNIPLLDRLFYHYLRDVVADYATKTIGVRCAIRQSTIKAAFEFVPDRGSRLPAVKLSNKQVEKLCERAVARGWVSRRVDSAGNAIPMQFTLCLIDPVLVRPNEEREWKGSGKGGNERARFKQENTINTAGYSESLQGEREMKGSDENSYEGGISSISSNNNSLSNAREGVSAISVDDFQIDDLLINRLRLSGIKLCLPDNREQLQLALVKFQSSDKNFSQLKPIDQWRRLFVGYCASWSANSSRGHHEKSNQNVSQYKSNADRRRAVEAAILGDSQACGGNVYDVN